ncbi:PepSY-associated TM helix domain-containing protein [Dyadobacter psychrotolerans]|uniref:PepSY domain-containing protein n=1 Tax=Dyadobacter psychrotolerans TaxID=2541721 RepID=A0A4R5DZ81_9BACT|nr:PepSY-associated TM helix domain-containing protein [Dyadobacter psychrotolerans]TDE18004.1 PepSY domain-containing protein [Dyadobacter psychrotolerans]
MKKAAGLVHLWLGLISGLIVFIVSVSGCIFVFEEEIFNQTHSELVYVSDVSGEIKPLPGLLASAQNAVGEKKKIKEVIIFGDLKKAFSFIASKTDKKAKNVWTYFEQVKYNEEVFVDPYTGTVLGVVDRKYEFFNVVRRIHQNLLLPYEIGSLIVGSACLMFLVLLITGFVLWLPKTKNGWKQRFTIKWNAKWRRVNYDSHNVGGFYVLPIAMIIVVTGLVWSFDWWESGIYKILGSESSEEFTIEQPESNQKLTPSKELLTKILKESTDKNPEFQTLTISLSDDQEKPYRVEIKTSREVGWSASDDYYYHSVSGKQFGQFLQEEKSLGQKWRDSNYEIHTGGVYGIATKILAFLASFLCASLPVTGLLIWWGKRNKPKKVNSKPVSLNAGKSRKTPDFKKRTISDARMK